MKLILKRFKIVPKGTCKCEQRAREMDSNGPDWCEEHIEEIVDWMEEEARNRHMTLLFTRAGAGILVRRAIKNARKKLAMLEPDDSVRRLSETFEMTPDPEAFQ